MLSFLAYSPVVTTAEQGAQQSQPRGPFMATSMTPPPGQPRPGFMPTAAPGEKKPAGAASAGQAEPMPANGIQVSVPEAEAKPTGATAAAAKTDKKAAPKEPARTKQAGIKVNRASELSDEPIPGVLLKFDNADIYEIIQAVAGDALKLNYMIDPSIQGRITLNTQGAVSSADIFSILESVLSLSGVTIVRDGKVYKFIRDPNAARDVISTEAPGENSFVIRVIPVRFVQAASLVNVMRGFISPQATIINDPTNRYLIIADRAANVAKVVEMMKTLDVDYLKHVSIRLIQIYKGDATEMAKEMDTLFKTSGLFNWPGTDANKVFFLPIVRMNALLVAGANEDVLAAAEHWVKTLDDEPKEGVGSQIHVYPVSNSTAVHIADIINQIYGGQASSRSSTSSSSSSSSSSGTGGLGGSSTGSDSSSRVVVRGSQPSSQTAQASGAGLSSTVSIIADEATNSLIIRANMQDYLQIKKVIERIDSVPRQVLIQVLVAEVALTKNMQYGVQWWLSNIKVNGNNLSIAQDTTANFKYLNPIYDNPLPSTIATGGLGGVLFNSAGEAMAMFDLMASDSDFNVLSSPHVLASDGKTAKIEVINEVPVLSSTVTTPSSTSTDTNSFNQSNSYNREKVGIILEVKPHINASGLVTMSLSQEISKVQDPTVPSDKIVFNKRIVETDITVEQGNTLLIAGLIEEQNNDSNEGIPVLKDIPLIGGLFGSTGVSKDKRELLIAITPYVIHKKEDGAQLTREFQESVAKLKSVIGGSSVQKLDETNVKLTIEPDTKGVDRNAPVSDVPVEPVPEVFPAPQPSEQNRGKPETAAKQEEPEPWPLSNFGNSY